jgi:energy-coupling factor transporter ATP-binding protein EcfA2
MQTVGLKQGTVEMSDGQKRVLGLALALAVGTKWCLLDEPLSHLHPVAAGAFLEVLSERSRFGAGILVVEHRRTLLHKMADRIVRVERA